jgi:hypothetical protein
MPADDRRDTKHLGEFPMFHPPIGIVDAWGPLGYARRRHRPSGVTVSVSSQSSGSG